MFMLSAHSSENGRFGRSTESSTAKSRRFSRLLRDLIFVSKLAVFPQDSRIFRIHILVNFEFCFWKPTVFRIQKV